MNPSILLLEIAAWLHLCQLPGTWFIDRYVVRVKRELTQLSGLARAIVVVQGVAVIVVLSVLGILVASHAGDVLRAPFGAALCAFLGLFWLARLGVQLWYYAALAWPRTPASSLAHRAFVAIFALQSLGYLGAWVGTW